MKAFDTIKRGLKITASIFGKVCLIILAIVTQRAIEYENTNTGTKFNVSLSVVNTVVNGVVEHPAAASGVAVGTIGTISSLFLKCNPIVTCFTGCISILMFIVDAIIDKDKLKYEREHENEMKMLKLKHEREKEMKMLELKANA